MYDQLVTKVNAIDTKIPCTSGLFTKTWYDLEKQGLEKKIKDVDRKIRKTNGLVGCNKTDCNTKTRYLLLLV